MPSRDVTTVSAGVAPGRVAFTRSLSGWRQGSPARSSTLDPHAHPRGRHVGRRLRAEGRRATLEPERQRLGGRAARAREGDAQPRLVTPDRERPLGAPLDPLCGAHRVEATPVELEVDLIEGSGHPRDQHGTVDVDERGVRSTVTPHRRERRDSGRSPPEVPGDAEVERLRFETALLSSTSRASTSGLVMYEASVRAAGASLLRRTK